ncbi:putative toxin-antitoxin system toxin component, PIN family [Candidatus Gottesmanbacteria bacterium]|nr:putative toxin-antitoxin system toxin component, PIN family [Candidatus Gottesmanbacteria bacterium]
MVRVVIDTNIWISAIFFGGKLAQILEAWKEEKFTAVFSQRIFLELENKLIYWGKKLDEEKKVAEYLLAINKNASFVYPQKKFNICRDPKDNMLLEAADTANVKYLVSGDKDLLTIKKLGKTEIISPRKFLDTFMLH